MMPCVKSTKDADTYRSHPLTIFLHNSNECELNLQQYFAISKQYDLY